MEYRGQLLHEMDVGAVIARQPQVALVDELAHTNVPGSKHPKRYQDVLDLGEHGINVISTQIQPKALRKRLRRGSVQPRARSRARWTAFSGSTS